MSDIPAAPPTVGAPVLNRNAGIDLVRVVGLVAVVGGHVFASSPLVRELTYSWHMPLFFFLTGYLWNPRRDLRGEWRTRVKSLALPYVVWVVLLIGLYAVWAAVTPKSLDPKRITGALLGGANAGSPFFTLWFVSALFFVALLYRLVCRLPVWAQWAIALAGVLVGVLFPQAVSHSPLAIGMALPCLIFVVAGAGFRSVRNRITDPLQVGLLLLVVAGLAVAIKVAKPLDLKHLDLGTPIVSITAAIAISAALLLIAEPLMRWMPARLGRIMTVLALGSLTVVFLHPLLMWFFPAPLELRWVRLLVVLVVPWVIGVAVAYTPATRWLNGTKAQIRAPRQPAASASAS